MTIFVALLGDAGSLSTWSGTPFHCIESMLAHGMAVKPIRLPMDWMGRARRNWHIRRLMCGRFPSGFQYSQSFLDQAESYIPREALQGHILSFSQHFPRASTIKKAGGSITYYIDATFAAISSGRGLDLRLPKDIIQTTLKQEIENYQLADRVVTMARWTAESVIQDCGINSKKVYTVMPGANILLPDEWTPPQTIEGRPGVDRPFVFGFIGKDWRRKGLPTLIEVASALKKRGWKVVVRAIGGAPKALANRQGVEFRGYIDKANDAKTFLDFLTSCDVGCLFSEREALGISTLEFLRAGIPVAGYDNEGTTDTIPPDAGFKFPFPCDIATIVDRFEKYLQNENHQAEFRKAALQWSPKMTWDRSVRELNTILTTGINSQQIMPWLGSFQVAEATEAAITQQLP